MGVVRKIRRKAVGKMAIKIQHIPANMSVWRMKNREEGTAVRYAFVVEVVEATEYVGTGVRFKRVSGYDDEVAELVWNLEAFYAEFEIIG